MKKIINIFLNILFFPVKLFTGKSLLSYCDLKTIFNTKLRFKNGCKIHNSNFGKYTYIGNNTIIINANIGSFCSISADCIIGLGEHPIDTVSTSPLFINKRNIFHKCVAKNNFSEYELISIGNDVLIGAHALIKTGITIGDGAVIGAGAIVTKDVPPYAIVAGNPAKILKFRFDEKTIEKLLKIKWWELDHKDLKKIGNNFNNINEFLKKYENNNDF